MKEARKRGWREIAGRKKRTLGVQPFDVATSGVINQSIVDFIELNTLSTKKKYLFTLALLFVMITKHFMSPIPRDF